MIEAVLVGLGNRKAVYENEAAAKSHTEHVFGPVVWGAWVQCEEPEAGENEWIMWGTHDGGPVVALYEEA
jgi:hypothetical protein